MKRMKCLGVLVMFLLAGCGGTKEQEKEEPLKTIVFDELEPEKINIDAFLDTSAFELIPLETREECLLGELGKIDIVGGRI
ncbi:MAG: 6-bladed beta-propeller [Cytophagales bacterium]|nr:6-bladed beta-propeller [Cytophagales bacterium]